MYSVRRVDEILERIVRPGTWLHKTPKDYDLQSNESTEKYTQGRWYPYKQFGRDIADSSWHGLLEVCVDTENRVEEYCHRVCLEIGRTVPSLYLIMKRLDDSGIISVLQNFRCQ